MTIQRLSAEEQQLRRSISAIARKKKKKLLAKKYLNTYWPENGVLEVSEAHSLRSARSWPMDPRLVSLNFHCKRNVLLKYF